MRANGDNAATLVTLGGLDPIVKLLRDAPFSAGHEIHNHAQAACALHALTSNERCLTAAASAGIIVPLVSLLRGGKCSDAFEKAV